jgi:DNA-binding HxlR family transcriptional regulator
MLYCADFTNNCTFAINSLKVIIMKIIDRDAFNPTCPIRNILSRIGDKWSILTLYTLSGNEVMRFKELQRAIPDISQKMLASTLRTLEEDGLVLRKAYAEVPPKVEYSLTPRALTLLPKILALITWAKDNMADILHDRDSAQSRV